MPKYFAPLQSGSRAKAIWSSLEAHNEPAAVAIVRTHSRSIHLLLIDGSAEGRTLAAQLQLYRPEIRVLFVAQDDSQRRFPNGLAPELVLEKVREFFKARQNTTGTG